MTSIDYSNVDYSKVDYSKVDHSKVDHSKVDHSKVDYSKVDYSKVFIEEKPLFTPPYQEVADVLSRGLSQNFADVSVSVTESPDLTQPPYNLTAPGLTGNPVLVELGGIPYVVPVARKEKLYDLVELAKNRNRDPAFMAGAGGGPWPHLGFHSEEIINLHVAGDKVTQGTHIMSVTPVGAAKGASHYQQRLLPPTETRTTMLANFLLSDGLPGKVLKVVVKVRTGKDNFLTSIRETLTKHYGEKVVGLGGMFLLRQGKVKHHVMSDFSATPLDTDQDVANWLHNFEMTAPITHVGTLFTGDMGVDLRVQHFHGWGTHGDGGHYDGDTTPQEVVYEAYFVIANSVLRVDQPEESHLLRAIID